MMECTCPSSRAHCRLLTQESLPKGQPARDGLALFSIKDLEITIVVPLRYHSPEGGWACLLAFYHK